MFYLEIQIGSPHCSDQSPHLELSPPSFSSFLSFSFNLVVLIVLVYSRRSHHFVITSDQHLDCLPSTLSYLYKALARGPLCFSRSTALRYQPWLAHLSSTSLANVLRSCNSPQLHLTKLSILFSTLSLTSLQYLDRALYCSVSCLSDRRRNPSHTRVYRSLSVAGTRPVFVWCLLHRLGIL